MITDRQLKNRMASADNRRG